MRKQLTLILTICSLSAFAQNNIIKTAGINYTNGAPTVTVKEATGSEVAIDTVTGFVYQYHRTAGPSELGGWRVLGQGIDVRVDAIAPTYTPFRNQSVFVVNAVDSLYHYRNGAWRHLNAGGGGGGGATNLTFTGASSPYTLNSSTGTDVTFAAGTGVTLSRSSNELTVTNSAPDQTVSLTGAGINVATGTYPNFTVTGTEVDGSTSNEIQAVDTLSLSGNTLSVSLLNDAVPAKTVDLSSLTPSTEAIQDIAGGMVSGNSESLISVTYDDTGGKLDFAVTPTLSSFTNDPGFLTAEVDGSTINEIQQIDTFTIVSNVLRTSLSSDGVPFKSVSLTPYLDNVTTDLSISGTSSPLTINSSDGTDVTLTAGTGITLAGTGSDATITNSAPDQTVSITGAGINAVTGTYPNFTVTGTEIDGSTSNELQTITNSSDATSHTVTLSNTGGSVQLVEGSGVTLTTSGSGSAGVVTIAASGGGGSVATDVIFDAKGDLPVGTGADAAAKLTVGTDGAQLYADASTATGLRWAPSIISPTQITSDQDNYAPTGWAKCQVARLDGDNGIRAITSFASTFDGDEKRLINIGSFPIYFPGEHPDGTEGNRILTIGGDYILYPGCHVDIYYDGTSSRWRINGAVRLPIDFKGILYRIAPGSATVGDHGELTLAALGAGLANSVVAVSGKPGAFQLTSNGSATGGGYVGFAKSIQHFSYFSDAHIFADFLINIPTLSDATNTFEAGCQITGSITSGTVVANNTIGVRYTHGTNSGKFQGYSRDNSGSESTVDLGITVTAGQLYKVRVEVDKSKTEARFYIDNVMCGRVTGNLPNSVVCGSRAVLLESAGSSARIMLVSSMQTGVIYP